MIVLPCEPKEEEEIPIVTPNKLKGKVIIAEDNTSHMEAIKTQLEKLGEDF